MSNKMVVIGFICLAVLYFVYMDYRRKMKRERRQLEFDAWSKDVEDRYLKGGSIEEGQVRDSETDSREDPPAT